MKLIFIKNFDQGRKHIVFDRERLHCTSVLKMTALLVFDNPEPDAFSSVLHETINETAAECGMTRLKT